MKVKADSSNMQMPSEAEGNAQEIAKQTLELFADHARRIAQGLHAFNEQHARVKKEIRRGVRRTSGRIV